MKKSSALLIAAVLILSSCGSIAQYASSDNGQKFKDGIYSNTPAFRTKAEKIESESDTQALVEKTQASAVYLFGEKKDTVMIPQDMSAIIRYDRQLGGTVVTVGENPYDWRYDLENNYGYYYSPYSIGSSWYWSRHYSPWYSLNFGPWSYRGWYDPWYYSSYWGWYDPWYYGGWYGSWYDPWYYTGYWGWYSPIYYPHHGWYDPYWGHHHHPGYWPDSHNTNVWYGSRHQTGSDRVFSSGTSLRGGIGSRSTVSRNSITSGNSTTRSQGSTSRVTPDRVSSATRSTATKVQGSTTANRSTVVRTTPSIRENATTSRPAVTAGSSTVNASRPASTTPTRTGIQSNHRKPAGSTSVSGDFKGTTVERNDYRNATSVTRPISSDRNSSTSFNRNNSSSATRSSGISSGGGGGYSRGSTGGGGSGYSRSGGSSGGRR